MSATKRLKVVVIRPGEPNAQRTVLTTASDQGTDASSDDYGAVAGISSEQEDDGLGERAVDKDEDEQTSKPVVDVIKVPKERSSVVSEPDSPDQGKENARPRTKQQKEGEKVTGADDQKLKEEKKVESKKRKASIGGGKDPEQSAEEMCQGLTNPHSVRKMVMGNVTGKKKVSLPALFARSVSTNGGPVTICDEPCERNWTLQLRVSGDHGCRFSGGWPLFVREIGLAEGDVVVFERIGDKKVKVHIFKKGG